MNQSGNPNNNVIIAAAIGVVGLGVAAYGFFTKNENIFKNNEEKEDIGGNAGISKDDDVAVTPPPQTVKETEEEESSEGEKSNDSGSNIIANAWKNFWKEEYNKSKNVDEPDGDQEEDNSDPQAETNPREHCKEVDGAPTMEKIREEMEEILDIPDKKSSIITPENKILSGSE